MHLLMCPSMPCVDASTLVLQMMEQHAVKLEQICRPKGIRLVFVRSYGLLGSLRVSWSWI